MRIEQLVKSASFRLAAAYAGLFTVSVGILAFVTYLSATSELDREMRSHISAEAAALRAEFVAGGTPQLLQAMSGRRSDRLVGGLEYTLNTAQGRHLFGDLPSGQCTGGWKVVDGPPDGDEPVGQMEQLAVLTTPLPTGECLLIGDDAGKVRAFGRLILRSFGWVVSVSLLLAVVGGIFLSTRFLRRIEAINKTAEAIIEGDTTQRIPRRGAPDDLDRLAATLNRMLDRTSHLMDSLRHVSNDVAHDLRTPLGRLRRQLENAKNLVTTPREVDVVLDQALAEVDGILETFSAILRIAQIESGSRRSGFQQLPLSELVSDVCETYAPSLEDTGRTLVCDIKPDLWITGDRELLVQSLANLLGNALAHTPAGSVVTVSLHAKATGIVLEVSDDGDGVPDAARDKIFERFYRIEPSRCAAGNGLGLSIVAAVADLHAAKLSAHDNRPGLKVSMAFPFAA